MIVDFLFLINLIKVSVPSFGDSFFMHNQFYTCAISYPTVSVPSFGDSFFIKEKK